MRLPLAPTSTRATAQRDLTRCFAAAGLPTPALDARLLLCAALGVDHAALVRDPDTQLGRQAATLDAFADRRLAREPVSRILERREFWGLGFVITPAVLDPRPETELIVETVLASTGARAGEALSILDLGTGSGAILAALLHERPQAFGIGIDRSFEACQIARRNIDALGLGGRGYIIRGSWADAVAGTFDVVVSNPPYISRADLAMLEREVRDHDPLVALDGGADGLVAYRAIVPAAFVRLARRGIAALEVGSTQGEAVAALARAVGFVDVTLARDLAGHGRVVLGRRPDERHSRGRKAPADEKPQ